jgi:hypothetical protein
MHLQMNMHTLVSIAESNGRLMSRTVHSNRNSSRRIVPHEGLRVTCILLALSLDIGYEKYSGTGMHFDKQTSWNKVQTRAPAQWDPVAQVQGRTYKPPLI